MFLRFETNLAINLRGFKADYETIGSMQSDFFLIQIIRVSQFNSKFQITPNFRFVLLRHIFSSKNILKQHVVRIL